MELERVKHGGAGGGGSPKSLLSLWTLYRTLHDICRLTIRFIFTSRGVILTEASGWNTNDSCTDHLNT